MKSLALALQTRAKPKAEPARRDRKDHLGFLSDVQIRAATEEETAAGFCGVLQGVALVYMVRDAYDTMFAAGCLNKTAGKVGARKVKLFSNHDYGTDSHVGTVLALKDVAGAAIMTAGLFNTEEGRKCKEYLTAVLASESETGLSVGFYDRQSGVQVVDGDQVLVFTEVELEEISLTPRQAVPGATVTGVRKETEDGVATAERCLRALLEGLPKERAVAIVAEVLELKLETAPPAQAPAAPPDEGSRTAHAPAEVQENVPPEKRMQMLAAELGNLSHS